MLSLSILLARNIKRSRIGRALSAIGVDEEGGQALGLDPFKLKLLIFTVGAGMAGLGGGLWAFYLQLAAPENWDYNLTISLVTYVVVGGVASIWGPFVGAVVVGALQYYVRFHAPSTAGASDYEVIMNGALLIIFILLFRDGLAVTFSINRIGRVVPPTARRGAAAHPAAGERIASDVPGATGRLGMSDSAAQAVDPQAPATEQPIVEVRGLTKRFGAFTAVDGVDFDLAPARITAMIGPNGAGKSTCINLLDGALLPTARRGPHPRRPGRRPSCARDRRAGRRANVPDAEAVRRDVRRRDRDGRP